MLEAGDKVLAGIATEIANAKVDLDKITNNLESQLAPLKTQFRGNAGTAFQNLHLAWTEKQKKITAALNEFEQSLYTSDKTNKSTDDAHTSSLTALQNKLGG
jgi:WXG100 family type VII secretion target